MHFINISPEFNPIVRNTDKKIECEFSTFKGGEEHVKITDFHKINDRNYIWDEVVITARITSSSEIMKILLLNDALKNIGVKNISLYIPYIPYARQDRIVNIGESFSIKVFANLINSCSFDNVYVLDPHSDVSSALLNNCKILEIDYYNFVRKSIFSIVTRNQNSKFSVISPDSGAYKKIYKTCEHPYVDFKGDIVLCNKVRNLKTNELSKTTITGNVKNKVCIIIDDICDGGRTFINLAKSLKEEGASRVYLIVTHGILSYGEEPLKEYIDHMYMTDSFRSIQSDFVTTFNLAITI